MLWLGAFDLAGSLLPMLGLYGSKVESEVWNPLNLKISKIRNADC